MIGSEIFLQTWVERLQSQEALNREYGTKALGVVSFSAAVVGVSALMLRLSGPYAKGAAAPALSLETAALFGLLINRLCRDDLLLYTGVPNPNVEGRTGV